MFVIENGDKIQGDASAATVVDYHISGLLGTTLKNLADGQLAATIGDLYTSTGTDVAKTIVLVNTDSSARTVNLYHTPSGGTARRIIPKDTSLGAGYSLRLEGNMMQVLNTDGAIVSASPAGPLSDLSDVTITSIASGEVLKWNGSAWVNNTLNEAGILGLAGDTMTGGLNMADNLLTRPLVKDYAVEVYAHGTISTATTIDLENGNIHTATIGGALTFTFSNPIASGDATSFLLELTNGGSSTVTWPTSVDWAGGTAPTLTAAGVDILVFYTRDGGTTWHGVASSLDSK